jgi:hypothetical protein
MGFDPVQNRNMKYNSIITTIGVLPVAAADIGALAYIGVTTSRKPLYASMKVIGSLPSMLEIVELSCTVLILF